MKIACILLIISCACVALSWLLGMRSLANDEIGDFLNRHDGLTMTVFYVAAAVMVICLGTIAVLVMSR